MPSQDVDLKGLDLLGRGRVHPAIHVDDQGVLVGVISRIGEYSLISSSRKSYDAQDAPKKILAFTPRDYPDLRGRWPDEDVAAFLADGGAPTFSEVLALVINALDETIEFPRPEHRVLIAVWVVASYFFPLFLTFPRLNLSGERESGKSKVLLLLRATAWNALLILDPTPAVLFRLVQEYRPSLLLDEVEGLNKEDGREVLAIINAGYKTGGTVPRCEGERRKQVELFEVYSPLALAGIRSVNATTEDRCIPIVMQRGSDRSRVNAEIDLGTPLFARVRAGCYRLLLMRWREVQETYRAHKLPVWLNGRARELWRPLLALAAAADHEDGLTLTPDLLGLAREHVEDREAVSAEGEALLAVLSERLGIEPGVTVRPGELAEDLQKRLGWQKPPSAHQAGAWLRRLGFRRTGRDGEGAKYEVTAERLADIIARYGLTGAFS